MGRPFPKTPPPSPRELAEIFDYNPSTGVVTRKANGRTGTKAKNGYIMFGRWGGTLVAHRIAWAIYHGEHPPEEIDHINGARDDNRISNLRLASRSENMANRAVSRTNKLGVKGVSWHPRDKRFRAQIGVGGKNIGLGYYKTLEEAAAAYESAAKQYFGAFASAPNSARGVK